jgi:hypothetical protein
MGLMTGFMTFLFGDGRNVVTETAQVFREHAENGAVRAASARSDSLAQFAAEFVHPNRGAFDRIVDGLNRLPRPALALGTIWLFVMAMQNPAQFAQGMEGLALVPEPLWWLMGAIVSFYFGARHQAKGQEFQRSVALSMATNQMSKPVVDTAPSNAALQDWQADHAK